MQHEPHALARGKPDPATVSGRIPSSFSAGRLVPPALPAGTSAATARRAVTLISRRRTITAEDRPARAPLMGARAGAAGQGSGMPSACV